MESLEPKKLALIRILQILEKHSDRDHHLKQEEIAELLDRDFGIVVERKAIGRNLSLLKEAGYDIESDRKGSWLDSRLFEDAELRMLIDGVMSGRHVTAAYTKQLIDKLCSLSSKYFRAHVKYVYSAEEWNKTENKAVFYNIDLADEAIESGKSLEFDYNKYGTDGKLHKRTVKRETPQIVEIPARLADANKAAELIGKRLMLWTERAQVGLELPVFLGEDELAD